MRRHQLSVTHGQRVPVATGGAGGGRLPVLHFVLGVRMGDPGDQHGFRIHVRRAGEGHDLAGPAAVEFPHVGGEEEPRVRGVLPELEDAAIAVQVVPVQVVGFGGVFAQVGIVGEGGLDEVEAADLVAADMVEGLLLGAVLVHLPGEELVEPVAVGVVRHIFWMGGIPGFGEHFSAAREPGRPGAFVSVIEGTVGSARRVRVRLLVPLQVVPLAEDHPAEGIHEGMEGATRGVLEQLEIAERAQFVGQIHQHEIRQLQGFFATALGFVAGLRRE